MQAEDNRVSEDATDAAPHVKTDDNLAARPNRESDCCTTLDDVMRHKQHYDKSFQSMQNFLTDLWGPAEQYITTSEDTASFFSQMYYTWVEDKVRVASREHLTRDLLPQPTEDVRTHAAGVRLSRSVQASAYIRHAWDGLLGAEVRLVAEPSSRGMLRWVGIPQQGGYTHVMAAVEWTVAPTARLAVHSSQPHKSPFFNGTVHGEYLFTPQKRDVSTLEETTTLEFVLAPRTSDVGSTLPTPVRLSLARQLFSSLPSYFLWQFPYKLTGDVGTLLIPVLLGKFVDFLQEDEPSWRYGLLLSLVIFAVQAIQSAALHRFYYVSIKGGLQYRGALTALTFEKCFTISSKALAHPDINPGHIINMVSTDVERANIFMQYCMYLWSSPLVFIVSIILLSRLVGWCSLMAVVAMILWMPINGYIMKRLLATRKLLVKATDARVKLTNEFFSGVRIAKYMTWEPRFIANIEEKRAAEVTCLRKMQTYRVAVTFINNATPLIMIAAVFILYAAMGHTLTASVVFPAISLLGIMRMPFMMIPFALTNAVQFSVSITRIRRFIECEDAAYKGVEDLEQYLRVHPTKLQRFVGRVAAIFEHADVTAFAPVKLPLAPAVHLPLAVKLLRRFCCTACRPARPVTLRLMQESKSSEGDETNDLTVHTTEEKSNKAKKGHSSTEQYYIMKPKTLLHDIDVQIPEGKLTLVVGATGSGKSTLLQSILGEYEVSRGHVWATKNIAYVPQQPWIMNATLRDNILFFEHEDGAALQEAIRVSQLEMDLKQLTSGLETEIGEKGVNLSGGQKARVNLARAVYANRAVYVLDDPLSALDAHVGERVVSDCILKKLAGKTRVLATHHLHVLAKADFVIALHQGRICFTGEPGEYLRYRGDTLLMHSLSCDRSIGGVDSVAVDAVDIAGAVQPSKCTRGFTLSTPSLHPTAESPALVLYSGSGGEGIAGDAIATSASSADASNTVAPSDSAPQMTAEERAVGGVPLSMYWVYLRACGGQRPCISLLLLFIVTECLAVLNGVWLSLWSTDAFHWEPTRYLHVYFSLVMLGIAVWPLRTLLVYGVTLRASRNLHRALLLSVSCAKKSFFDTTPSSRILNRFTRDINIVDTTLNVDVFYFMQYGCSVVSSLLVMLVAQPIVVVAIIPSAWIYYKLTLLYSAANREARRLNSLTNAPVIELLEELLDRSSMVVCSGKASIMLRVALTRLDVVFSGGYTENMVNLWLNIRLKLLTAVIIAFMAFAGVLGKQLSVSSASIGLISLSFSTALTITGTMNGSVEQTAFVEADMNSVERILYYIDHAEHEDDCEADSGISAILHNETSAAHLFEDDVSEPLAGAAENLSEAVQSDIAAINTNQDAGGRPNARLVQAGSLEFRHVALRYRDGLPLVLRDVTFTIEPRAKVGIVGRTGSGKSTLLLAFMRMVDISEGEIVVNGAPIRSYPLRQLRRLFSMIPQDPVLFDGTVRLNVDPFLQATSEEVWHALEVVGLRQRIEMESEGIDSHVQEGGNNFSVGQRQLLCMARALLKRGSGFILMDEATANVDQQLDQHIQNTVMAAFSQYTVITIAHRLQTIARYDRVIVMDGGAVAETGTPRDLMSRPTSLFRRMVESLGKAELRHFITAMESSGNA